MPDWGVDFRTGRSDYGIARLDEEHLLDDPIEQLKLWIQEAVDAQMVEPTAMTLATVGMDGHPSARMVLLRGLDERGAVFYTSSASRKGRDLAANPYAALVAWWGPMERQVRMEGTVVQVSELESDAYFASRPRDSQVAAHASPQSEVLESREELESRVAEIKRKYRDRVPRPHYWGGYRVVPDMVEFWQGRRSRLHDRFRYTRADNAWVRERLAP